MSSPSEGLPLGEQVPDEVDEENARMIEEDEDLDDEEIDYQDDVVNEDNF